MNRSFVSRTTRAGLIVLFLQLVFVFTVPWVRADDSDKGRWWSGKVEEALGRAGGNRGELLRFLGKVSDSQRPAASFLLENMPQRDLESLKADYLRENLRLAFEAKTTAAWGKKLPEDVFLNDVLPYANANEAREAWRSKLREKCLPLVKECKSPGEAAHELNRKIFKLLGVRYSTKRNRADQAPAETIETGLASCTGLSILLVDACRSVGVPARLAGTPNWVNKSGNHTWVEVWDDGWHFAGAAEPDSRGLDHGWFQGRAAQAIEGSPEHAIYATSFRKTGTSFPLVWAPGVDYVSAVNVTGRYVPAGAKPQDKPRLLVRVLEGKGGARVVRSVELIDRADLEKVLRGNSRDESNDTNDILSFKVEKGRAYDLRILDGKRVLSREYRCGGDRQDVVSIFLADPSTRKFKAADEKKLTAALKGYFSADEKKRAGWKFSRSLDKLLAGNEAAARAAAWKAYLEAPLHSARKEDFDKLQVRFKAHLSPYTLKSVGKRPEGGWPLFIAMHGGGGVPKRINDSQWRHMQIYYRDQASVTGYQYLALRAPNDTWNGFYADYVYPLIENLVRQCLLFGDVNPDKVFIMGYSHGGYGAFSIGPKIPYRFAAIHSSAAAPTDGQSSAKTLRNTIFTFMIGEKDQAYGRLKRCQGFDEKIRKLRGDRKNIYPVKMEYKAGYGHGGLPDRDKIKTMYPAVRDPVPAELTWEMTDGVVKDFFWLSSPEAYRGRELNASCRNNKLVITSRDIRNFSVLLDERLVDFSKPVTIELNGRKLSAGKLKPSLKTLVETLSRRGDIRLAATVAWSPGS
jgi:transglutaminase-like putative cysteine protease